MAASFITSRYLQFLRVVLCFFLLLFVFPVSSLAQAIPSEGVRAFSTQLTPQEAAWLLAHPTITVAINNAWPPMDYVDERGKAVGIGVDFIDALNKRLDGALKIVPSAWTDMYEGVKEKRLDALMDITPQPEREPFFNFTRPYVKVPHIIFAKNDGPYFDNLKALSGKSIGVERDFFIVNVLKENYPTITVREYADTSDALDAVSKGDVDAYVGNRAVALHLIEHELIRNVVGHGKISETSSTNAIGVRKDQPILRDILQKALDDLSNEEIRTILVQGGAVDDEQTTSDDLGLTHQELAWLEAHPTITVTNEFNWPPYDFNTGGEAQGFSVDYLNLLAGKVGLELSFVTNNWAELLEQFKAGEIDVIHPLYFSQSRQEFTNYTKSFFTLSSVMVMRKGEQQTSRLEDLHDRVLAVPKGWLQVEMLQSEHPSITVLEMDDSLDALKAVQFGDADAAIDAYSSSRKLIDEHFMTNLKIVGEVQDMGALSFADYHIGVRKDWPVLRDILQKAMDTVSDKEIERLNNKWKVFLEPDNRIHLTKEEKLWLWRQGEIIVDFGAGRPPFEFVDENGQFSGMSADYMALLSTIVGLPIVPGEPKGWKDIFTSVKTGNTDIISAIVYSPERENILTFLAPHIIAPLVIVTGTEVAYVNDLSELKGKPVAVHNGSASERFLRRDHPELKLLTKDTVLDCLQAVSDGQALAYIESFAVASHVIAREGITNLKVSGSTPYNYELSVAVDKNQPMLASVLGKALASITQEEKTRITQKWLAVKYETRIDYSLVWQIGSVGLLIILMVGYWNRRLTHEVAERKRAEQTAETANKAKSAFLANMSHEIRTPMNGVLGMAEVLLQMNMVTEQRRMVQTIRSSATSLLTIIDDILDTSKIEAGKLDLEHVPVPLHQMMERVAETMITMADAKNVQMQLIIDSATPEWVLSDEVRLRQILLNLTNNAVKFSKQEKGLAPGRVQLKVERSNEPANGIRFSIVDNGIGMSDEVVCKLFKPFSQGEDSTTRQFGGTGLGLLISHKLTEMMQGSIEVKSAPGEGTTFILVIPLEETRADDAQPVVDVSDLRVMVLSDCEEQRALFSSMLVNRHVVLRFFDNETDLLVALAAQGKGAIVVLDEGSMAKNQELRQRLMMSVDTHLYLCLTSERSGKLGLETPNCYVIQKNPLLPSQFLSAMLVLSGRVSTQAGLEGPQMDSGVEVSDAVVNKRQLVLLVEDNLTNQEVVKYQLDILGYDCEIADDGVQGLELWQSGRFDLVLTDCHMPEMDGYEMTAQIRKFEMEQHKSCTPIVALTANALQGESERCQSVGMDDYLSKPVELKNLKAMLQKWGSAT